MPKTWPSTSDGPELAVRPSVPRPRRSSAKAGVRSSAGVAALIAALSASLVIPLGSGSSAASARPTGSGSAPVPAVASCPSATSPNGRYVAFLFDEILGRCHDAGAARYWTAVLDGGASRWSVAEARKKSTG